MKLASEANFPKRFLQLQTISFTICNALSELNATMLYDLGPRRHTYRFHDWDGRDSAWNLYNLRLKAFPIVKKSFVKLVSDMKIMQNQQSTINRCCNFIDETRPRNKPAHLDLYENNRVLKLLAPQVFSHYWGAQKSACKKCALYVLFKPSRNVPKF